MSVANASYGESGDALAGLACSLEQKLFKYRLLATEVPPDQLLAAGSMTCPVTLPSIACT